MARNLTRWWPHTHEGVAYSLNHLHPDQFDVALPAAEKYEARTVTMHVGFSCHTFTREWKPEDTAEPYLRRDYEIRMFCRERHNLAQSLPTIVRTLPGRKCYFGKRDNYFVVESHPLLPAHQEYRVFFDLRHIGVPDAVLLYVQSAYAATWGGGGPAGIRNKKVGFRVLINHALQNTKPVPPP